MRKVIATAVVKIHPLPFIVLKNGEDKPFFFYLYLRTNKLDYKTGRIWLSLNASLLKMVRRIYKVVSK